MAYAKTASLSPCWLLGMYWAPWQPVAWPGVPTCFTGTQVHFLLSGAFSRACKALGGANEKVEEIRQEVAQLRQLLVDKLVQVTTNLEGE